MLIGTEKTISIAHLVQTADEESPCRRLHGHTVKVNVTVEGIPREDGMVIDFRIIKEIVNELDHKTLIPRKLVKYIYSTSDVGVYTVNTGYSSMQLPMNDCKLLDIPSITSENLVYYLIGEIRSIVSDNVKNITVRVWEGPKSWAETTEVC